MEAIDHLEEMKKFKIINDMPIEQRKKKDTLFLEDIIQSINGYGRII